MTESAKKTATDLWKCGLNDVQIAKKLGVCKATIQRFRRLSGLSKNYGSAERRENIVKRRMYDAELIRDYRHFHNLSQTKFGEIFGVSFKQISAYERGVLNAPQKIIEYILNEEF